VTTKTLPKNPNARQKAAARRQLLREVLAEPSSENAAQAENRTLGDLILRTLTPEEPKHAGAPEYQLMRIAALELKALAMACSSIGHASDMPSDDPLTAQDLTLLTAAIASRLDASAELCRRLTEARWKEEGFPGYVQQVTTRS
jgi:hypothetical protein